MPIPNEPTVEDIAIMKLADLYVYQRAVHACLEQAKQEAAAVDGAIAARLKDSVDAAYQQAGKSHGTVRLHGDGDIEIVGNASKKVEWDQGALRDLAAKMDWGTVSHFFKITFSVPEKVYDGLPPDDPRKAALDAARTVKYGAPKITLERKEG